jgi:hypothetical protein
MTSRVEINKRYYLKNKAKVAEHKRQKRYAAMRSGIYEKLVASMGGDKEALSEILEKKIKHEKNMKECEVYRSEQGFLWSMARLNADIGSIKFGEVHRVYWLNGVYIIITGIGADGDVMYETVDESSD